MLIGLRSRCPQRRRSVSRTTWFVGGRLNVANACVERWRDDPTAATSPAVIHEDEAGNVSTLSYAELGAAVDASAAGLRVAGIGKGDTVAVFLPMAPEAVIAAYAIAKVGALYLPLFCGFAPAAIAARLQDAQAKLVFTTDGAWRRGSKAPMKQVLDDAVDECPSVQTVVVLERDGCDGHSRRAIDVSWEDFAPAISWRVPSAPTDAEDPPLLGFTSGTTARPKGAVHTHAGFLVKIASEVAYEFDVRRGDVFFWVTDMGWVMGPLSAFGTHALGATLLLYEGAPDTPGPARLWEIVERHRVSMFGRLANPDPRAQAPRRSPAGRLRSFVAAGVRSDGRAVERGPLPVALRDGRQRRVPIINFSGGTEVGGSFLAPFVVEPVKPCSLGGPSLGMDVDVFDAGGKPIRGELGELVCRQPWPAMTRGVWGDPERYIESYWSMFPGVWRHGDWTMVDDDGQWFLFGRSDEAINVAGKRVGPAEVESVLVSHPAVAEAAAVGVPDEHKGEAIWCFWTPADGDGDDVSVQLRAEVAVAAQRRARSA